jgi:hypothetical protein
MLRQPHADAWRRSSRKEFMTYRIDVVSATEGDVVTAALNGSVLRVTANGRELSPGEYQLSCDHDREIAGCPACVQRVGGSALRERLDHLSEGVGMSPPRGTWGTG